MKKLSSLSEAVATIPSGSHVALSGFAITRCTMAFAREVLRQGIQRLTVSQCVGAMDTDLLVGGGAVERLIYGGGSLDRFGRLACVNAAIESGSLNVEEYSSLSIAFRYLAGSLGIPFIPIRSLSGSSLLSQLQERNGTDISFVNDPFTGDRWLALKPLRPDVAVVQVQTSDEEGNAWIMGPKWDSPEQVKASTRTIVIAEHVVPTDIIRREPERCVVPNLLVSHVVDLPFGAHPTSLYREYDYDGYAIKTYLEATQKPDLFKAYLDKYIYGARDHWQYLELIGGLRHLRSLGADPILGY